MSRLFYLLLVAHLLGDFIFQNNKQVQNKQLPYPQRRKAIIEHVLQMTLIAVALYFLDCIFLLGTFSFGSLLMIFAVGVLHGVIDNFKPWLREKIPGKFKDILAFSLDQLLHFLSILILLGLYFGASRDSWLVILKPEGVALFYAGAVLLLFSTVFAAYFIRVFLMTFSIQAEAQAESENQLKGRESFGFMIGLVERTLIFLFVVMNAYAGVATVVAVKSLARFKEIENDRDFAEYYLIGNLLSLFFGLTGGLLFIFLD